MNLVRVGIKNLTFTMSGEEKQFEFDGWLKDNELTQTTKESLVKAGFESERSLKKLSACLHD